MKLLTVIYLGMLLGMWRLTDAVNALIPFLAR